MEKDCSAEIIERAGELGIHGWCRAGEGYVEFEAATAGGLGRLADDLRFTSLVFARQWCGVVGRCHDLPPSDRAGPLADLAAGVVTGYSELRIEHPDSTAGRPLARLARALLAPLRAALAARGVGIDADGPVVHVFLVTGQSAFVGLSDPANGSPWWGGIPRLKLPARAPSRSVLKLDEAFGLFLHPDERALWLAAGRRAVDLGAAPGGWTWLLAERGLRVVAVDNADLAPQLVGHPHLTHVRADGFSYRPRGTVDWLVCDMVERPHRIARLAGDWLARGRCRHVVVNLKLPMKKRWAALRDHLVTIRAALPPEGRLSARQLYHDREEVTVFATRAPLNPMRTRAPAGRG